MAWKLKRCKLPPLPTTIPSVLGPVAVSMHDNLRDANGSACLGIWNPSERRVRLESNAALLAQWHTYWHEHAHVTFWDAGLKVGKKEERICDALATARVREMLDNSTRR